MNYPIAILRFAVLILILLFGIITIPILSLVPFKYRGIRLPIWITVIMARMYIWISNVQIDCADVVRLRAHRGIIFPNHSSHLDIVALVALTPLRFLGAIEVKRRPVIGYFATAIGCIFVDRQSNSSRRQARDHIIAALRDEPDPPLVIYPEGRLGPGNLVYPFRRGSFKIAVQNSVPFLPLALRYTDTELTTWYGPRGESIIGAAWRMAKYEGPIEMEIVPLEPIYPRPTDDAEALMVQARRDVARALGMPLEEETPNPETPEQKALAERMPAYEF